MRQRNTLGLLGKTMNLSLFSYLPILSMENTSEKKKEKKKKNTSEDIVQHNDNTAMIKPLLC